MEPLKTRGLAELTALRKRVRRARAMGRIQRLDFEYLEERMDEIEARIVQMTELTREGEEVGHGFQ